MPAKKGTKKKTVKKDIVEAAPEEVKVEKTTQVKKVVVEEVKEDIKVEPVVEETNNEDFNGESEDLNIVERFVRFETETKIGIIWS